MTYRIEINGKDIWRKIDYFLHKFTHVLVRGNIVTIITENKNARSIIRKGLDGSNYTMSTIEDHKEDIEPVPVVGIPKSGMDMLLDAITEIKENLQKGGTDSIGRDSETKDSD
jgi:hypothetical protein